MHDLLSYLGGFTFIALLTSALIKGEQEALGRLEEFQAVQRSPQQHDGDSTRLREALG
jgi:hypothetical protein